MDKVPSVVRPDVLNENKVTINSFLKDSYTNAKKQIQGGINAFKDELREIRHTAEACFDFFALPVNNYLKDISQIDSDFKQAPGPALEPSETSVRISDATMRISDSSMRVVSITEALSSGGPMEENY